MDEFHNKVNDVLENPFNYIWELQGFGMLRTYIDKNTRLQIWLKEFIIDDVKRKFRIDQIETEGNDPAKTGVAYGTPHSLASLYGPGRYENTGNVPKGYDEKKDVYPDQVLGRPKEKASTYNTQDSPLGRDRLGTKEMGGFGEEPKGFKTSYKGGSPLALENTNTQITYHQIQDSLKSMFPQCKIQLYEEESNLLNEDNLLKEDI